MEAVVGELALWAWSLLAGMAVFWGLMRMME